MLEPKRPAAKKPAAKPTTATPKESNAALVRALLDQSKTVRECADALKDRGLTWSYCWDVATSRRHQRPRIDRPPRARLP